MNYLHYQPGPNSGYCSKLTILYRFVILLLFLYNCPVLIYAQTNPPNGINYQAIARTEQGKELLNTPVAVRFSIRSESAAGAILYQELHRTSTNQFGLFNLIIGQGSNTGAGAQASMSSIDWNAAPLFLVVELSLNNGTDYIQAGSTQLMAVPFAMGAKNVAGGQANKVARWDAANIRMTSSNITDDGAGINIAGNVTVSGSVDIVGNKNFISATAPLGFNAATGVISYNAGGSPGGISIPSGTTAQRTPTPTTGTMRFNTSLSTMEVYDGSRWLNINTPPIGATYIQWANAANPNTLYPNTTWVGSDMQNGEFIRARGGNANVGSSGALTAVVQTDAVQQHGHTLTGTINGSGTLTSQPVNLSHNHGGSTGSFDVTHNHTGSSDSRGDHNHEYTGTSTATVINISALGGSVALVGYPMAFNTNSTSSNGEHSHAISINQQSYNSISQSLNHTHSISSSLNSSQTFTIPSHSHTNNFSIGNMNSGTSATETRPQNVAVVFWRRVQ